MGTSRSFGRVLAAALVVVSASTVVAPGSWAGDRTLPAAALETTETRTLATGIADSSGAGGAKWRRVSFTSARGGSSTLRLSWTGSGDLRFSLVDAATGDRLGWSPTTGNPRSLTRTLAAGASYWSGLWSFKGVGTFTFTITEPAEVTPPADPTTYVTLLFSRSETSAADRVPCEADDRDVATLSDVVAPFLASRGYSGTGTIQTGSTLQAANACTHYGETQAVSWDGATRLAADYGWHFVSHSATYPTNWSALTPAQIEAQTCGSAATLDAHGLPGAHGLFAWPSDSYVDSIQADYVSRCFAFGRQYSWTPTTRAFALTPPYYQRTKALNGGACNDPTLPCFRIKAVGNAGHYDLPSAIVARLTSLAPGDWYSIQAYLLVTGTSPDYETNSTAWDCTSSDPRQHWTNDNERYCWSDYQAIVDAIPADAVVADPSTVAAAIGRPGY